MNKRQRNKRIKYEKKIAIQTIDFLIKSYSLAADMMREEYEKMPEGFEKTCNSCFISGHENGLDSLVAAKELIGKKA